jgi:hypothetical protein
MGVIREVLPVKPICAVMVVKSVSLSQVVVQLENCMGAVEDQSDVYPFSFTSYYADEMGKQLDKQFFSFTKSMHPEALPGIKRKTNELEEIFAHDGKRCVNIDPGYLTGSKLVLASTKDFAHRIFLAENIYGDLQLQFRHNAFWPEAWTFPDYKTDLALTFFTRVRTHFVREGRHDQEE